MSVNIKKKIGLLQVIIIASSGCLIYALNNGIRVNYGLITNAIVAATGIPATDVSLSIAIAQLLYGFAQPFFGVVALKTSNSFAIILGAIMLSCGFYLRDYQRRRRRRRRCSGAGITGAGQHRWIENPHDPPRGCFFTRYDDFRLTLQKRKAQYGRYRKAGRT